MKILKTDSRQRHSGMTKKTVSHCCKKQSCCSKNKGFTYMEMVVTMIIIIALSLLSYPIYTGRQGGKKDGALVEGYALLGYVVNAQIAYFNEYGNFLSQAQGLTKCSGTGDHHMNYSSVNKILGINAINNRYFSSFNAFGFDTGYTHYAYRFKASVKSKDYGTIYLEYNLTQRFEPVVTGI